MSQEEIDAVKKSADEKESADELGVLKKDIKHREQLKEAIKENEQLRIASEKEKKELLEKTQSIESMSNSFKDKYALAELKAQAIAAGLTDVDFIKMIDTSTIK